MVKKTKKFLFQKRVLIPFLFGFFLSFSFLYFQDSLHLILRKYGILDFAFSIRKQTISLLSVDLPYTHIDTITVYFKYKKPNIIDIYKIEIYGANVNIYKKLTKKNIKLISENIKKYIKEKFQSRKDSKFKIPIKVIFNPKIFIYKSKIKTPEYSLYISSLVINDIKHITGQGNFIFKYPKYNISLAGKAKFNWKLGNLELFSYVNYDENSLGKIIAKIKNDRFSLYANFPNLDTKNIKIIDIEKYLKKYEISYLKLKNLKLNISIDNITEYPVKYKIYSHFLLSLSQRKIKLNNEDIQISLKNNNNIIDFSGKNTKVLNYILYFHKGRISTKDFNLFNLSLKLYPNKYTSNINIKANYYAKALFSQAHVSINDISPLIYFFPQLKKENINFKNLNIDSQINLKPIEVLSKVNLKLFSYKGYDFQNITLNTYYKDNIFQGIGKVKIPNIDIKNFIFDLNKKILTFNLFTQESFKKISKFLETLEIKLPFNLDVNLKGSLKGKIDLKDVKLKLDFSATGKDANLNISSFSFPIKFAKVDGRVFYDQKNRKSYVYIFGFGEGKTFTLLENSFPITLFNPFANFVYFYPKNIFTLNSNFYALVSKFNYSTLGTLNLIYNKTLSLNIEDTNKNIKLRIFQKGNDFNINGSVKKLTYEKALLKKLRFLGSIYPELALKGNLKTFSYLPIKDLKVNDINFLYKNNIFNITSSKLKYKTISAFFNMSYYQNKNLAKGNLFGNLTKKEIKFFLKDRYIPNINLRYILGFTYDIDKYLLNLNLKGNLNPILLNTSKIEKLSNYYSDLILIKTKPFFVNLTLDTFETPYILKSYLINLESDIYSKKGNFKRAYLKVKSNNLILNLENFKYKNKNLDINLDVSAKTKNYLGYTKYINNLMKNYIISRLFDTTPETDIQVILTKFNYVVESSNKNNSIDIKTISKILKKYNIKVKVSSKNLIKIKGKLFEILGKLKGNFPGSTNIYIEDLSGNFDLLGYKFIILNGNIQIDITNKTGKINLIASTKKDDFTIFCIVSGDLQNPEVIFISYPYLPQNEILTLLLGFKNIAGNYIEYQTKYFSIKPKFSENTGFESYMISLYVPITPRLIFEYSRLLNGNELSYDIKYKITKDLYILSSLKKEQDLNIMELGIGIEKNIW